MHGTEEEIEDECERVIHRFVSAQTVRRMRRKTIPQSTRIAVFQIDSYCCWICGKKLEMDVSPSHPYAASIDHVVPLSKGGTNDLKNLRAAHRRCNTIRGNGDSPQKRSRETLQSDYATFNDFLERLVRQGSKRVKTIRNASGLMRVSVKEYIGDDCHVLFRYQGNALKGNKIIIINRRDINSRLAGGG